MDEMDKRWRGLRVAVSGGRSGLGLALVEHLGLAGAHVAFVARGEARVRALAALLPGTHGIVGDVADMAGLHAEAV